VVFPVPITNNDDILPPCRFASDEALLLSHNPT
jgi:hypothetical protein